MVRQRVRVRFTKLGDLRFLGHRDVMRCFERWFRRAGLKLSMTEGFHPKPRMNFLAPLALGLEGLDEVLECDLAEHVTADGLRERLTACAPPGWRLGAIDVMPEGCGKGRTRAFQYQANVPEPCRAGLSDRIEQLMTADRHVVNRGPRRRPLDIRPRIDRLAIDGPVLSMRLLATEGGEASPRHVLTAIGVPESEQQQITIQRTAVEIE